MWESEPARQEAELVGCLRCDGPLIRVIESDVTLERRRATSRRHVGPSAEIQLANRYIELMEGGDRMALLELVHPEIVIDLPAEYLGEARSFCRFEGVVAAFRALDGDWPAFRRIIHTLRETEDGVVGEGGVSALRKDGHRIESPASWRFELSEGRVRRLSISLHTPTAQVTGADNGRGG